MFRHLILKNELALRISLTEGDRINGVIPSLDPTIMSASHAFKDQLTIVILTGMGSDGREGSRALRSRGATIIAQDQASSDIYGMPMAIAKAGLADVQLSLVEIAILISGN